MATLLDALSDGSYDLQNKRDLSGDFSRKLLKYRDMVVSEYLKYKISLNNSISKIAKQENLNDDQIQRIVEEVNNQIYLTKYEKLKGSVDREVEFDIASVKGVRECIKGHCAKEDLEQEDKKEYSESKTSSKVAFESVKSDSMEKVASTDNRDIFNGMLSHSFGDLSVNTKYTRDEFMLGKIASAVEEKECELNKIAKEIKHHTNELSEVFVHAERLGSDVSEIMSTIIKSAELNDKEVNLVKEAIVEKIATLKDRETIPSDFLVNFDNVSIDKKASELFTLGKFSLIKTASVVCDTNIPKILLSTNRVVSDIGAISKIACDLKSAIVTLSDKNNEYIQIREKCAAQGIDVDTLEKNSFFQ